MYELRSPSPSLRPFIEHYWFLDASDKPVDLRVDVFVDGRADLVFNFGAGYSRQIMGGPTVDYRESNLDAQRLVPIRIIQRGRVRVSGVRFRLGGLGPFVRVPLKPFTGATPPPWEVFGESARDLERDLKGANVDAQAALLDAFFARQIERGPAFESFEGHLARLIETDGGSDDAKTLEDTQASRRQVERLFARYLGIPPRTVARILRFQRAMRMLMRDPGVSLAEVAAECGYFDHAHFIKDFKRMSGGVPRGYRGYYPEAGPHDFAPNVVAFLQDRPQPPEAS